MKQLKKDFFMQDAYSVSQQLIGKWICISNENSVCRFQICETECYLGTQDTACHASKGKTPRTSIMWNEGGVCYVYLCYGMHHMLNFITGRENQPEGVLIRGVNGALGPGRATKAMGIDKSFNGKSVLTRDKIWLEDDGKEYPFSCHRRVGIGYASEEDQNRLWRFVMEE